MKLISLEVKPSGVNGWGSDLLEFGEKLTGLYGENGTGKTPLIHFLISCLGFDVKFRDDIYHHCKSASLRVEIRGDSYTFEREIDREFSLMALSELDNKRELFFNEDNFSEFLFEKLSLSYNTLITNNNRPTKPYISSLLPLFYLDQDIGYSDFYKPPARFVKDQYSEMMRLCFDIKPKHSFDTKKELLQVQRRTEDLDKIVNRKKETIDNILSDLNTKRKIEDINVELDDAKSELEYLKNTKLTSDETVNSIDLLIRQKKKKLDSITFELNETKSWLLGVSKIRVQIEAEIETLVLNEDSRKLFSSFSEICPSSCCSLFKVSSESFGKNLLYLKDQLKDLASTEQVQQSNVIRLEARKQDLEEDLSDLFDQRTEINSKSDNKAVVETISMLVSTILELEKERTALEFLENEENEYTNYLNQREECLNRVAELKKGSGNGDNLHSLKVRKDIKENFVKWLDILNTTNVSREIVFDSDFKPLLGYEVANVIKGSTKTRLVLAMRAAVFEAYLKEPEREFRFLILDTPKQQEIQTSDLINYLNELNNLAKDSNAQIIYSSTEFKLEMDSSDREWIPKFEGFEKLMYLGHV